MYFDFRFTRQLLYAEETNSILIHGQMQIKPIHARQLFMVTTTDPKSLTEKAQQADRIMDVTVQKKSAPF